MDTELNRIPMTWSEGWRWRGGKMGKAGEGAASSSELLCLLITWVLIL